MISVITPTWQRHEALLHGAIPAVANQTGVTVEHIVVSDGLDFELERLVPGSVRYFELPFHDVKKHWGSPARNFGLAKARGDYIAYLDDDDDWEPDHLETMLAALESDAGAEWVRSCATIPVPGGISWRIGDGRLMHGRVTSSMIMHRRTLEANWPQGPAEDWKLVKSWEAAGVRHAVTGYASVTYRPSAGSEGKDFVVTQSAPGPEAEGALS